MNRLIRGALVVFGIVVAGSSASAAEAPPGLRQWLEDVCPADRMVMITDRSTGQSITLPCSDEHATFENSTMLQQLYLLSTESRGSSGGAPEEVGEVQQPITPFSIPCFLLTAGATVLFNGFPGTSWSGACDQPGSENPQACGFWTGTGLTGLSLACVFA